MFQAEVTASARARGRSLGQRGEQGADCAGLVGVYCIHRTVSYDLDFANIISARLKTDLRGQGWKQGGNKEATVIIETRAEWGQEQRWGKGNGERCPDDEFVWKAEPTAGETKKMLIPLTEMGKLGERQMLGWTGVVG